MKRDSPRPSSHTGLRTSVWVTFSIIRLGIGTALGAWEEPGDAPLAPGPTAEVPRNPVEVDGDDHDPKTSDERPAHVELAETPDHNLSQASSPDERGDDNHRECED